eukprot:1148886-Pelagomonas_calceolata.AAC.1
MVVRQHDNATFHSSSHPSFAFVSSFWTKMLELGKCRKDQHGPCTWITQYACVGTRPCAAPPRHAPALLLCLIDTYATQMTYATHQHACSASLIHTPLT